VRGANDGDKEEKLESEIKNLSIESDFYLIALIIARVAALVARIDSSPFPQLRSRFVADADSVSGVERGGGRKMDFSLLSIVFFPLFCALLSRHLWGNNK
jgi:hypothetical protein